MTSSRKQVLVHLDASRASALRLDVARRLAQQQGAALAALYATVPVYLELPYAPDGAPGVIASLMEVDNERRAAARKRFDEAMKTPGPAATWGEASGAPLIPAFAEQAFCADLLVLGQRDPDDPGAWSVPADFVESVLVASGRPGLVVPYGGWTGPIGSNVAIAWKPSPEAARAVTAALPLLRAASQVHILIWGEETEAQVQGGGLSLEGYLGLHGVRCTSHRGGPEPEALGEIMLSRVFDLGADLLVMGCYGHSRAREWVLGGASRTILSSMTLPVLMAH